MRRARDPRDLKPQFSSRFIRRGWRRRGVPPREFENVFAPFVKEGFLSVEQILLGIRAGAILPDRLPPDAQRAVDAELKRRTREQVTRSMLLVLLLGTMGEIKHKTRLQKYLFLADNRLAQQVAHMRGRLVCDWRPRPHGPFSESLDLCVDEAVDDRIVEVFRVRGGNGDGGAGYRLTDRGRARFGAMLQTLEGASRLIHGMLLPFQSDPTERPLLEFVHKTRPQHSTSEPVRDSPHRPLDAAWPCRGATLPCWPKSRSS